MVPLPSLRRRLSRAHLAFAGAAAVLAGCATGGSNLLANPSFEDGEAPWYNFRGKDKPYWGPFEVSAYHAFAGDHSVRLPLHSDDYLVTTGIAGAAQDVATDRVPRRLSGRYLVEHWMRGTRAQYVQVVVIAQRPENFAAFRKTSVQLAFVLAGIDEPPFPIDNRVFVFGGPLEPERGRWIGFDFDLHEAFRLHWGKVPEGIESLRVLVEARFDRFEATNTPPGIADVYFDGLYLGD